MLDSGLGVTETPVPEKIHPPFERRTEQARRPVPSFAQRGGAAAAQLGTVPPCSRHPTVRATGPGAAGLRGKTLLPLLRGGEGRSEALTAPLGARIGYSAHEDKGVEGGFPDEEQEGPVGVEDYSVHGEGAAGDGDGCSS